MCCGDLGFLDYDFFLSTFGTDPRPLRITKQKPHAVKDVASIQVAIDEYVELCTFDVFLSEYRRFYVGDDKCAGARTSIIENLRSLRIEFPKKGGGVGTVSIDNLFDCYMTLVLQLPADVSDWGISLPSLFDQALTRRVREQMSEKYKLPPASTLVTMESQLSAF